MSAFLIERFPPDYDRDDDRDDGEPDEFDPADPHRRQRPKIRRCRLTAHQLQTLNHVFEQDSQPSMESRIALGSQLGMETKQVSAWFQNKRQKLKNAQPTPFTPSSQPSSSYPREFDAQHQDSSDYHRAQQLYRQDLPPHDYTRYHQGYLDYQRGPYRRPFATLDHEANYPDRYPVPHYDRLDMKPTTSTFQVPPPAPYLATAAGPRGLNGDRMATRSRSVSSRSASAATESSHTTDFMPSSETTKEHPMMTKAKREPVDEDHHSLALAVSSPPPDTLPPSPGMMHKTVMISSVAPTNRRTSTRARSARLAASPLMTNNRPLSSTASPASNHNETQQQKRLTRSRMSASQRAYLHNIYEKNSEPTMAERQAIADKLGVQVGKITNWFRNLRQSVRRGKLLDAQLSGGRGTTAESKADEENEMDIDDEGSQSEGEATRVSRSPAAAPAAVVPGKALHSPPYAYVEEDDDEEEEEAHEALTPHPSPEAKVAHSFGHSTAAPNTPENLLTSPSPSRAGICLPSINITLAPTDEEKKRQRQQDQKFQSSLEDALLLLHFRQNCDVRDIHHGVVVGRPSSPSLF